MLIWTANCVDPSTWQSSQSLRRDFMSSIILVIFSWSSDIVSILFRKTTRSASDFPFTAVPLPSDPLYNKAFSTRFKIVFVGSLKGSFWPNYIYTCISCFWIKTLLHRLVTEMFVCLIKFLIFQVSSIILTRNHMIF